MYVLGINAAFHDSSAALLSDGVPVAAAEEERFTRIKHGKRPVPQLSYALPFHAIAYCLDEAGIGLRDVAHVAYSYEPALARDRRPRSKAWDSGFGRWESVFLDGIESAPRMLLNDIPHHLRTLRAGIISVEELPPFTFVEHHMAHAASAYYVSGFEESAILTLDGRGERTSTMLAMGSGAKITKLSEVEFPHSLGLLYERVTSHLGFLNSSDEYKVMALASSGGHQFDREFEDFVTVGEEGLYVVSEESLSERFGPPRGAGEPLESRHYDLAASLQRSTERTALSLAQTLKQKTGMTNLCMAGGVALNCVMNSRIRDDGPFENVFVQPAAGDAGTALGAAYIVDARQRGSASSYVMEDAFLGPEFDENQVLRALERAKATFERPADIAAATADLLAEDRIVGWFQGRMEFGPRSLGARSLVASPRDPNMKDRLNTIKDREEFRPVAPAVLDERAVEYFAPAAPDPFMLFVRDVLPERAEEIPAVRHDDGSARVQTVSREHAPLFHALISAFAERTGVPVVVNTSFNSLGRPIVCTPQDALECYFTTPLDALAIGPFLLRKPGS